MENESLITDKEYIRGVIRKSVVSHDQLSEGQSSTNYLKPLGDIRVEFWRNFQANGGKILRCRTNGDRMNYLKKLSEDQQYNVVLNTHENLRHDLERIGVNFFNAISTTTPVDAVVTLSTLLVARNGSIGFTQPISRFLSMRNLARDVIVISRVNDIVPDIESALHRNLKFGGDAGVEFIAPSPLPKENGKEVRTLQHPRYILLLLDENRPQNA